MDFELTLKILIINIFYSRCNYQLNLLMDNKIISI